MSQLAMPLLVVNMGCEMVYILEQRLKAQNIAPDKACKVLNDVIRTMFDPEYVDKLFAPQDMYTVSQTRKIFDRLAHSSIMRLSESRSVPDCVGPSPHGVLARCAPQQLQSGACYHAATCQGVQPPAGTCAMPCRRARPQSFSTPRTSRLINGTNGNKKASWPEVMPSARILATHG